MNPTANITLSLDYDKELHVYYLVLISTLPFEC